MARDARFPPATSLEQALHDIAFLLVAQDEDWDEDEQSVLASWRADERVQAEMVDILDAACS